MNHRCKPISVDSHQRHIADLTDDYEKKIAEEYMSRQVNTFILYI